MVFISIRISVRASRDISRARTLALPRMLEESIRLFSGKFIGQSASLIVSIFSSPNVIVLPCTPLELRTHPRTGLILQNGIADGAPEVDRPKRAVPDTPSIPSALRMMHRYRGFATAVAAR